MKLCLRLIHVLDIDSPDFAPVNDAVREAHRQAIRHITELVRIANRFRIPIQYFNNRRPFPTGELNDLIAESRSARGDFDTVVYAGFAADFSLGTLPKWGFVSGKGAKCIVPDATLALHIQARDPTMHQVLSNLWPEWYAERKALPGNQPLPWKTSQELIDETKRFCLKYARRYCGMLSLEEFEQMCRENAPKHENKITIVSVPLPFTDFRKQVQENAIGSWVRLDPKPEILLFAGEQGTAEIAQRYGLRHVEKVGTNKYGLSMRSIFRTIDERAENDIIAYVDTDVILMPEFVDAVQYVDQRFDQYLMGAGRWSARVDFEIDFSDPLWKRKVWARVFKRHNKGSDYAVYRRGLYHDMPDFTIGCGWWDGWRMGHTLRKGAVLVNAQRVVRAVHQDHGLRRPGSPAWGRNKTLAGNCQKWVEDSTHVLTGQELGLPELKING